MSRLENRLEGELICIADVGVQVGYEVKVFKKGDVVRFMIDDYGIALEYEYNHYTDLLKISSVSKYFEFPEFKNI